MNPVSRGLGVLGVLAILGGPLGTAPATAQTAPATQNSVTLGGTATDGTGAALAGVTITLTGPQNKTVDTAADGTYRFSGLPAGIYAISAHRAGYTAANLTDIAVAAGVPLNIDVRLEAITFSSIREIGRTSTSYKKSQFNVTPAAVATLSSQNFVDAAQPQVQRVLDTIPGLVIDHPGTNATDASPGAITFPSIRGGLGFETASLIDGHPLAVGTFGDYVTTFLNAYSLGSVETIKGPGASSPEVNYAIGGTVNFRTLDPAAKPSGHIVQAFDGFGGTTSDFLYTGTTKNRKFGWVLDYGIVGTPGPLNNANGYTNLASSMLLNCTAGNGAINFASPTCATGQLASTGTSAVANAATNGIQNNPNYANSTAVVCCIPVSQTYTNKTELFKFKYKITDSTVLTASYLGSQTWTDQNGNHAYGFEQNFQPGNAAYTGALAPGAVFTWQSVFFPSSEWEINNEPILQAELRTTIGNDNVLLRGYAASINRLQYNGQQSLTDNAVQNLTLYGAVSICPNTAPYYISATKKCGPTSTAAAAAQVSPVTQVYNGQTIPVTDPAGTVGGVAGAYFRSAEEDKLKGGTIEYDHPLGDTGGLITASLDQVNMNTASYSFSGAAAPSVSIYGGSRQQYTTGLLRGIFALGPKLQATVSNYFDRYVQIYTPDAGKTFNQASSNRYDGRIAFTYRKDNDTSIRFSAGSAIAPPYLSLLGATSSTPVIATGGAYATQTLNAGTLLPETSMGYDLGADIRLPDGITVISTDIYTTNLFNQFLSSTSGGTPGPACPSTAYTVSADGTTCLSAGGNVPATVVPIYTSQNRNLGNSRYQGIEFSIKRDPAIGFGFLLNYAGMRGYPYNISPCFYSTTFNANGTLNCSAINTNLGVVNGLNYLNSGTGGTPGSFNAVSNHSEPYSQGYYDVHWRWTKSGYFSFGQQYYGANNSFNSTAFFATNASLRFGLGDGSTTVQLTGDNLFPQNGAAYIIPFAGVADPLVNGKLGLTNLNGLGPTVWQLVFTKKFGQ